jgi:hypothetical protein
MNIAPVKWVILHFKNWCRNTYLSKNNMFIKISLENYDRFIGLKLHIQNSM